MHPRLILAASAVAGLLNSAAIHAATLAAGDLLTVEPGVWEEYNYAYVESGSYFGLDYSGNGSVSGAESTPLEPGLLGGIVIGQATLPGAAHAGAPTAGDSNAVTAPWILGNNTGSDWLATPVTGSTEAGLDFSGWRWLSPFGKGQDIVTSNLGSGAFNTSASTNFTDGIAQFDWDGVYGHSYKLVYRATFAADDPSAWAGLRYQLVLKGTVQAVPEAQSWALMLAGLGMVGAVARRRSKAGKPDRQGAG